MPLGIALAVVLGAEAPSLAGERIGAFLDFGIGRTRTQPFSLGYVVCGTVGAGLSTRPFGAARASCEFRATAGDQSGIGRIPENGHIDHQSLVTLLACLEFLNPRSLRGPFFSSGLGVGRSISGGGRYAIDLSLPMVPPSDRTAAAVGLGLGYRFSGGPGPMHIQIALRTHGLLLDATSASAYATVVALGIAY